MAIEMYPMDWHAILCSAAEVVPYLILATTLGVLGWLGVAALVVEHDPRLWYRRQEPQGLTEAEMRAGVRAFIRTQRRYTAPIEKSLRLGIEGRKTPLMSEARLDRMWRGLGGGER